MDRKSFSEFSKKVVSTLKKYKYAALVLVIGLALLLLPFRSGDGKQEAVKTPSEAETP